ncbi:MAG: hypothetical protein PHV06_09110 [bacterium]|nr:hypothetical protein [bacterium]
MVNKRKQKIIKPRFQFRMFSSMILLIFFIWITTILLIYSYSVRTISEIRGEELIIKNYLENLSVYLVLSLFIVIAISYFMVIHLSHKIAGPLYRFETVLKQMKEGKIPDSFKIRSSDSEEIISISELLNSHITDFRKFYSTAKDLSLSLDKILSDNIVDANEIKQMQNELKSFQKHLDKFELTEENIQEQANKA